MVSLRRNAGDWRVYAVAGLALALVATAVHGADPKPPDNKGHAEQHQAEASTAPPPQAPPPPVQIVQVEPSPKAIAEAAKAEATKRRFFGLDTDEWIAVGTIALACFTAALMGATGWLAVSTKALADGAEDQAAETRLARVLAEKQYALAVKDSDLAEKQHGLQLAQFLAEHRPRIWIRSVAIERARGDWPFEAGTPIVGSLVIANEGACDATILETKFRFLITQQDLPMVPPLENDPAKPLIPVELLPLTILGHGSHEVRIHWAALGARADLLRQRIDKLYLFGAIHYDWGDVNMADGTPRESWRGFCRVYTMPEIAGSDGRFEVFNNPDYEYSD